MHPSKSSITATAASSRPSSGVSSTRQPSPPQPEDSVTDDPHPAPSIRAATRADIDPIAVIEALSFYSIDEIFTPKQIARLIRSPNAIVLVAASPGSILGWGAVLHKRTRRGVTGRIYSIAIHPDARGQRLGDALARELIRQLREHAATRIYLEVRTDNEAAIRLYKSLGFTVARTLSDYYAQDIHAYSMRMDMLPISDEDSVSVSVTRAT
ncbi:MAG: N-acetyltransferase [Phycisphaeraceae bacterium]|nr:MAG: N-acetyltransferase [Phycisphaeraceae bacterium]